MTRREGHKWFAAIYDRLVGPAERSFTKKVREETAGEARGRVLEIGAGTGLNFPYYRDGVEVVATEPDPYMLRRAEARLRALGRPIALQQAQAEHLPFEDGVFDTVIGTLVLCTVEDPLRALAEIRRVLKREGEYRFYEHVRYDHSFGAFWQDVITPIWRWFSAGCHLNRDTARLIQQAGFRIVDLRLTKPVPPVPPAALIRPHICGVACPQ